MAGKNERRVLVNVRLLRGGIYQVCTFAVRGSRRRPIGKVFTTPFRDLAVDERNRRGDRWARVANTVIGEAMPVSRFI